MEPAPDTDKHPQPNRLKKMYATVYVQEPHAELKGANARLLVPSQSAAPEKNSDTMLYYCFLVSSHLYSLLCTLYYLLSTLHFSFVVADFCNHITTVRTPFGQGASQLILSLALGT